MQEASPFILVSVLFPAVPGICKSVLLKPSEKKRMLLFPRAWPYLLVRPGKQLLCVRIPDHARSL